MATSGEDIGDEDRLPWLETVEEDYDENPSILRIAALVVLGLALIAALVYAVYWIQQRRAPGGNGALIAAQEGNYKVKPDQPGGMKANGEGTSALATSEGADNPNGSIDLKALPEKPIAGKPAAGGAATPNGGSGTATATVPASGGALKAKAPISAPSAAAADTSNGSVVQLGAFPDQASANAEWSAMSKRFAYLAPLGKSIQSAEVSGHKVYRLRVNAGSADQASELCGKLKVAGEACYIP